MLITYMYHYVLSDMTEKLTISKCDHSFSWEQSVGANSLDHNCIRPEDTTDYLQNMPVVFLLYLPVWEENIQAKTISFLGYTCEYNFFDDVS